MVHRLISSNRTPMRILEAGVMLTVDAIYPRRCGGCGRRGTWLCATCDRSLERFAPPWCPRCGIPNRRRTCACADLAAEITWARSIGQFDGWLRGSIVSLKYHGEWSRGQHLAGELAPVLQGADIDIIVPVPLHASRLKQRGFNQSLIIATGLAPLLGVTIDDCLVRTRQTPSQTTLGAVARQGNVAGAFALSAPRDFSGATVALIDDVLTTGATIGECARVLHASGAVSIGAATLARELD